MYQVANHTFSPICIKGVAGKLRKSISKMKTMKGFRLTQGSRLTGSRQIVAPVVLVYILAICEIPQLCPSVVLFKLWIGRTTL